MIFGIKSTIILLFAMMSTLRHKNKEFGKPLFHIYESLNKYLVKVDKTSLFILYIISVYWTFCNRRLTSFNRWPGSISRVNVEVFHTPSTVHVYVSSVQTCSATPSYSKHPGVLYQFYLILLVLLFAIRMYFWIVKVKSSIRNASFDPNVKNFKPSKTLMLKNSSEENKDYN